MMISLEEGCSCHEARRGEVVGDEDVSLLISGPGSAVLSLTQYLPPVHFRMKIMIALSSTLLLLSLNPMELMKKPVASSFT